MKKNFVIVLVLVILFGCKQTNYQQTEMSYAEQHDEHPGKRLMQMHCYVCHNPETKHEDRIAPPMIAVKNHYLVDGMTKAEFNQSIKAWINNPTEENVKMRGAVRKFGIMPNQSFSEEAIDQITDYIYDNDLDKPGWVGDQSNLGNGKNRHRCKNL